MTRRVLLDTGPLVAFLSRRDRYHRWATTQWAEITPPLLTCEPVVTETCFLLRRLSGGTTAVMELLDRGVLKISFRLEDDTRGLSRLMARYANVPMSLADACLVRMFEQQPDARVMTLDQDFHVYRAHGRRVVSLITPAVA